MLLNINKIIIIIGDLLVILDKVYMRNGINSKGMKYGNALLVLETIMMNSPISRSDLTKIVGLTHASVINITNALLDANLICETGKAPGVAQGRRSLVLDIKKDAFYSLGLGLVTGKLYYGLANACGQLMRFEVRDFPVGSSIEEMLKQVEQMTTDFFEEFDIDKSQILGMGVAAPGPLNIQQGILINPPNFSGWEKMPICEMLENRLNVRVCLDKETNLAALAEEMYGSSTGYKTSFFISIFRLGVGGGLVTDGNIFHGYNDGAGEVGHVLVDSMGPLCGCGNYGCLEAVLSEKHVIDQVQKMYKIGVEASCPKTVDDITLEEIFSRSEQGDWVCRNAVKHMAAYISLAICDIINMFSPEIIIIGGSLPRLSNELIGLVKERVHERNYPEHCKNIKIVGSKLGAQVYVKGAVALVTKSFFNMLLSDNY